MIGSVAGRRIMIRERVELSMSGQQLLRAHDGHAVLPIGRVTLAAIQPNWRLERSTSCNRLFTSSKGPKSNYKVQMGKKIIFATY
ncbi:uncharacterized protein N7503_005788 [Penicillium pulvis]|uniref:uncharacterized protein n=1 Tax=Penicillium pulvis TaxID=1562058 RepID=UPI0025475D17|nr:uncharacterized protein N7503_005788 [Penicillium pulvis]KAJ5803338.1 hypothetical protein N7503_005788 [Penicillium pulvis]